MPSEIPHAETAPAPQAEPIETKSATRFFTSSQHTLVEELSESIIPADSHLVPTTSSKSCAKASMTVKNRSGVKGSVIDRMSQHYHGKFFVDSSSEERIAVLTILSHNDQMTDLPEVRFFRELKHLTIRGYYTSKIGIHDELEYKANRVLLE